jgi:hypothetical protein
MQKGKLQTIVFAAGFCLTALTMTPPASSLQLTIKDVPPAPTDTIYTVKLTLTAASRNWYGVKPSVTASFTPISDRANFASVKVGKDASAEIAKFAQEMEKEKEKRFPLSYQFSLETQIPGQKERSVDLTGPECTGSASDYDSFAGLKLTCSPEAK